MATPVKLHSLSFYVIRGVQLNFRFGGMAVTALQLQWEPATRMTFVNETRPFRANVREWQRKGSCARARE